MGVRLTIETAHADGTTASVVASLEQPRVVLGRGPSADVVLPHASVSLVHATLRESGPTIAVVDERSTNGTRVNDARIVPERARALRSGDVLRIGPFRITIALGLPIAQVTTAEEATGFALRLLDGEAAERALVHRNGPSEGARIPLGAAGWSATIGRGDDATIRIDDAESSRLHAELVVDDQGVLVRDAGSKNGVVVNGKPVTSKRLHDGDELEIGATVLALVDPRERALRELSKQPEDAPSPPEPPPPEPPEPVDEEPAELDVVEAVAPAPSLRPPRPASDAQLADRLVFGLAIVVLGLSIAAIAWLFGAD